MKVYLDTDLNFPSDDFQALMLLRAVPEVEIVGCGAAAGNTWAEEVFANIQVAAKALKEDELKVWQGASHTLFASQRGPAVKAKMDRVRNFIGAHEKSPSPRRWITGDESDHGAISAAEALVELSRKHSSELVVVCMGPLSNISKALEIDPRLSQRLRATIVMGGCFAGTGNGEEDGIDFNFWFDPEAAHRVMNSGMNIRLVPLDVCRSARLTGPLLEKIARFERGRAGLFCEDFLGMVRQHGHAMALTDQLAAIVCAAPSLVTLEQRARVKVDCSIGDARGASTLVPDETAGVSVVRKVDVEGAHRRLVELVERMSDQECRRMELFETPQYQYFLGQRLASKPLTVLRAIFDKGYRLVDISDVQSPTEFADTIRPLARLLIRAKARSELWPPAPRADAIIAKSGAVELDQLAIKELEHIICERFMNVRAIATISRPCELPRGFACISELTPERLRQLQGQFGVSLSAKSIIAEYSFIERQTCGPWASDYIGSRLFLWYYALRSFVKDTPILAVSLSSQTASRHRLLLAGYEPIARHIIPEGPEKDRVLILYSAMLNEQASQGLRARYGDDAAQPGSETRSRHLPPGRGETTARSNRAVLLIAGAQSWREWMDDFVNPDDADVDVMYEPKSLDEVMNCIDGSRYCSVVFLSHHSTLLRDACWGESVRKCFGGRVVAQPAEIAALAYDKRQMARLAAAQTLVLPIPEVTESVATRLLRRGGGPLIVKPLSGTEGVGFHVVCTEEQLWQALDNYSSESIIQPFIQGHEYSLNLLRVGEQLAAFPIVDKGENSPEGVHPAKRLRHCPSNSADPPREETMQLAAFLMAEAGHLDGLCEFEFLAARDAIYLVEINPRVAATMRMSSLASGSSIFDQLLLASLSDAPRIESQVGRRFATEFPVPNELGAAFPRGRLASDVWVTTRVTIVADEAAALERRAEEIRALMRAAATAEGRPMGTRGGGL